MNRPLSISTIPPAVVTLDDHERHAQTVLNANAWAYFSGGAGDEITLAANRSAWSDCSLQPRVLRSLAGGHTRIELLGRTLPHPILLAPVAYQTMAHPDGELATAHAAAAQGAGLILSTLSGISLETIAAAIGNESSRGPLWFQLYIQSDRALTLDLIRRAEEAGYEALVVTVDAPISGVRDRERRVGFRLPTGVSAVNLSSNNASYPPMIASPLAQTGSSGLCGGLLEEAPTWDEIEWLQAHTRLPVIAKGIVHPDDAREAARLGLAAIIVSNHGGRTLDTCVATAKILPVMADTVAGRLPILVDGGIRRGTDVFKALALGANAVLIGRPYVFALANAGAVGVAHVIRLLRDELEAAMALCGCATIDQITSDFLWRASKP